MSSPSRRRPFYFFASSAEAPRARRGADLVALLGALALLAISIADHNSPSASSVHLTEALTHLPAFASEIGREVIIIGSGLAIAIAVAACVGHRWALARDMAIATVAAFLLAVVVGRVVTGQWPQVGTIRDVAGAHDYPVVRIAVLTAVISAAMPYLSRPWRWASRALILCAGLAAIVLQAGALADVLGAVAVGWAVAAGLHLVVGSPGGTPTLERVRDALGQLGVQVGALEAAGQRDSGVTAYRAVADDGRRLVVQVAGRDAHDAQLAARLWRSLWRRDSEARLSFTRLQMVEHEALMMLLADRVGVRVPELVAVGETRPKDALIVLVDAGEPLAMPPDPPVTNAQVADLWEQLLRAHEANLVHRAIDVSSVLVGPDGAVVLTGWRSAVPTSDASERAGDVAAMLATTALLVGVDTAFDVARSACGDQRMLEALPYLQAAAFGGRLREHVKESGIDLGDLRSRAADGLGAEPPAVVRLQRVSIGSILMALLVGIAVVSLLSWIGNVGLKTLLESIADADGAWVLLALVVGQGQFLAGAVSVVGSVPTRIPYGPTVLEQMAIAFVKLAVPSSAARVVTNVRYLQFQGVPRITAFGAGGLDSIALFLVQIVVLIFLVTTDIVGLDSGALLDITVQPGDVAWRQIVLAGVVVVCAVASLLMIRRIRNRFRALAREAGEGTRRLVDVLRSWQQLARLVGGNFASELVLAFTLWLVCRAYGVDLPLATLLAIHVGVSLINGFVPVPGGIGVWETLLSTGLVAAGVSEVDALAIAITWRVVTFYLPPIWGAYAMRWLAHHGYL